MMRNILKKFTFCLLALVMMLSSVFVAGAKWKSAATEAAVAETVSSETSEISDAELALTFKLLLYTFVEYSDSRVAGSDGEEQAAEFIYDMLSEMGLSAVSMSSSGEAGYQNFKFSSTIDGQNHTSQNVIFQIDASADTDKTVILAASYDSLAIDDEFNVVDGDSINGSAGSVALLLTLAAYLVEESLDYNVMFVFFGAEESNSAGSKIFTDGLTQEMQENIILMVNFDKIVLGENLYFYVDETETSLSKFASSLSTDEDLGVQEIDLSHLGKIILSSEDEMGLEYTHIARSQTAVNFMKLGVLSMNVFAGDYSSGVVIGRSEFAGEDLVTYTENDNISYIETTFGAEALTKNLISVFNFVSCLILSDGFIAACEASLEQTSAFYSFFGNSTLIIYLEVCIMLILIVIAAFIYYKLSIRSFVENTEKELAKTILSISENIRVPDEERANIPKVVGQTIVRDIKKSRRFKRHSNDE